MFLTTLIGNMELLSMKCRGIGPHLAVTGKSHEFSSSCGRHLVYSLELRRGWPFVTRVCSAKSGLLSSNVGHHGKLLCAWQEHTDASRGEPGGQASLNSWQSYIGIPINFLKESGIVTF